MPVVSRYCNICNRLITTREIESGEAIVYQTYYYCPKCKKEAMPIIEAIRRRQEREQEKEAQEAREKKSSTRFGTAPGGKKHRPTSSTHKLRKTRSGIFQDRKSKPSGPRRPHAARMPHGGTGRAHPPPVREPAAPAQKPAGDTYKPAAEFDEVKAKASGQHAPAKPVTPVQEGAPAAAPQQPAAREPDSERIEVISELQAPEARDVEDMTPGEVVAAAEPRESSSGGEEQLAASGITFEDVAPAAESPTVEPEGQLVSLQPVEEATAGEAAEPEAREVVIEPEAVQGEVDTPEQKPAAEPAPVRIPRAKGKFPKHVHPGKRRIAHVPPQKKPWLFIVVILLMALGGGGLIAYKQFFMPEKKEESIEERQEREEKEQYAQLEKEIDALMADARKIVTNPEGFKELSSKASELGSTAMPRELRAKLTKALAYAEDGFASAAKEAFTRVRSEYEKALSDRDLAAALNALQHFPAYFADTEYPTAQIPALKSPVEKTFAIRNEFKAKKSHLRQLERQGSFKEAASLIEGILLHSYERAEVLPAFLAEIGEEAKRLRGLAKEEEKRRAVEAEKVRTQFEEARREAGKLTDDGSFQEAMERLGRFNREYPGSGYEGEIIGLVDDLRDKKRRATLKSFFNGHDLNDWTRQGEWKVESGKSQIVGISAGGKMWLLKGDPNWTDYVFEFDFCRKKGSLVIVLRAASGKPESGFTQTLSERPFQKDTWYHVKCTVSGNLISITTSFNNQEIRLPVTRACGMSGFLLPPNSDVRIKNVSMVMP